MEATIRRLRPGGRTRAVRRLLVVAALAIMAGCASGPRLVRTDVTAFNEDWSALPASRTYVFKRTLEFQGSLEVKSYEDIVRDELAIRGFRRVDDETQAALVVTLRPTVLSARVRVRNQWPIDPFIGPAGFYGRGFYGGAGWYGGYGGFGPFGPYGPYGSAFDDDGYAVDVSRQRLELDIDSRTVSGKRYYEGRVETSGQRDLTVAMPYLIRALFSDFPGNNGQTRQVDVPMEPAAK